MFLLASSLAATAGFLGGLGAGGAICAGAVCARKRRRKSNHGDWESPSC